MDGTSVRAVLNSDGSVEVTVHAVAYWGDESLSAVGAAEVTEGPEFDNLARALEAIAFGPAGAAAGKAAGRTAVFAEGLAETEGNRRVDGIRIDRSIAPAGGPQ